MIQTFQQQQQQQQQQQKMTTKEKNPLSLFVNGLSFFSKCHLLDQGKSVFSRSTIKFQLEIERFF